VDLISSFLDIGDRWPELFEESTTLDALAVRSRTWRNAHIERLRSLLSRPGGRIRFVFPDVQDTSLMQTYSHRLGTSIEDVQNSINDAVRDMSDLAGEGHGGVELYAYAGYIHHAYYLFEQGGILALYTYRQRRMTTPALFLSPGPLLDFARQDFEFLVGPESIATRRLR
jgi:hypothetical protein